MEDFQQPKPTAKKRPVVLLVVIGIAGFALIVALSLLARNSAFMDYNYALAIAAKAENFGCPKMIDESTRLDSVKARHDRIYSYYYSFVDMSSEDIENENFCEDWELSIIENITAMKEVQEFGKNGVTLTFDIKDKTAEHLCTVTLSPEKYYKPQSN